MWQLDARTHWARNATVASEQTSEFFFRALGHALAEQRFTLYENVREWLDNWFDSKDEQFYWRGIHHLPVRWEKCVNSNGDYFE